MMLCNMLPNLMKIHVLTLSYVCVGHPATKTIQITNLESMPFNFAFVEGSCHASSHGTMLKVTPMEGAIQPNSR